MALKQRATQAAAQAVAPQFVSILDQQKTINEAGKEPGLIPAGVWLLRATSAKLMRLTREDKVTGAEITYERLQLVHEPLVPGADVDPEVLEEVDESGKSVFDGKRIFTKINLDFAGAERQVKSILLAHGYDGDESLGQSLRSALDGSFKNRKAYGVVSVRSWMGNDGEARRDNEIKAWTSEEEMNAEDDE